MNNYLLPSDARLEQLIRDSFEHAPGPDMRRLNQLEARLARTVTGSQPRRKLNSLPGGLILLLTGGFAVAAWWAGEQWFDRSESLPITTQIQSQGDDTMSENGPDTGDGDTSREVQPATTEQDSAVIYQRENF